MKKFMKKIADVLGYIYGYGIMLVLFLGGFTFFGYVAALIIGGDTATQICTVIYKGFFPYLIYGSTVIVLIGLLKMYLSGEVALTISSKREKAKMKKQKKAENKAD